MNLLRICFALSALIIISTHAFSDERLDMQGTAIIGNQELPRVLYIVPWKQSELPNMADLPLESLIDDALAPVDREEFKRQLDYHNALSIP